MTIPKVLSNTLGAGPRDSYSQGLRAGTLLFVSGQLPLDLQGRLIAGTICDQAKQALLNLPAIVEAADGTLANVV
jgi:2-iminobutanoate/2-iminopropanoate deaminase